MTLDLYIHHHTRLNICTSQTDVHALSLLAMGMALTQCFGYISEVHPESGAQYMGWISFSGCWATLFHAYAQYVSGDRLSLSAV